MDILFIFRLYGAGRKTWVEKGMSNIKQRTHCCKKLHLLDWERDNTYYCCTEAGSNEISDQWKYSNNVLDKEIWITWSIVLVDTWLKNMRMQK